VTKKTQLSPGKKEKAVTGDKAPALSPDKNSPVVVAIGASAGGLEALEQFLAHLPADPGPAFVIIQHLDPTHKGIMPELLQRVTPLKVVQVNDRMKVEANHVYVIPPNTDMSILHGTLHLLEPTAPRGLRLPIDYFFRSLADDEKERSIGVILSGMGTDGTMGLRAIKEKAGLALVQDPAGAKFDGMPRSAIDAGLADIVAPAEELPKKIMAYLQHALVVRAEHPLEAKTQSTLEKIIILLRARTGTDFSLYKKNTIYRRVERRMGIHQIDRIASYARYLQENPQELDLLFKELLIGVTSFFRDPVIWDELKEAVFPPLFAAHRAGDQMRAWVAGCSTGEEAYSLAMVFRESAEQVKGNFSLQVFATDLDQDAIERARQGHFPDNIAADVTPERLKRFFVKDDSGYRVNKEIREMVIFAPQNLIADPPFTKLDILACRNLLIYLTAEVQKKLLPLFHYSLRPGGVLFLGNAETIGSAHDLFTPLDARSRLFVRNESGQRLDQLEFARIFAPVEHAADEQPRQFPDIQSLADRLLLQHYAPAAVITNDKGDILYVSGRTGKYLEPAAGKANWNIFAMSREGLAYELAGAFRKAMAQKGVITVQDIRVRTEGGRQAMDLTVEVIQEPEPLRGMVAFVFTDRATPEAAARRTTRSARVAQIERELRQARDEVQTNREEMQTSQEELKSTNEELQSTNEELQSTNEELTTSKEEMQSMNEELQTVNAELQAKVDELSRANNDMKNLLNSTSIATVFLDADLNVRRFTPQATRIINLISSDIGRPVAHITTTLVYPELRTDVGTVLQTLVFIEKEIPTSDGHWFVTRIMPYRTLDNTIDGVVITFMDITRTKELEAELRRSLTAKKEREA